MEWLTRLRAAHCRRASPYRVALADLPAGLEAYWRRSAPREYQGIRTDAFFFVRAAEGLLRFFDAVRHSGQSCALPSEAADSVWHAWLRWNPIGLERFCLRHFGAALPHVERARLASGTLLATYAACRTLDGAAHGKPYLPLLFRLDARLRMPRGHGYWSRAGEIRHARLNERGRGMWRGTPHPELAPDVLVAAGLVDPRVLAARQGWQPGADGASCGGGDDGVLAFAGGDACADGGAAGDGAGGCDGGSACGSSCGSSCGGGD
jgi:hypothetical protein